MLSRRGAGIGIDLGQHTIKVARVEPGARPRLTHWGLQELGPDEKPSEALKRLLSKAGLRRRKGRVAVAVGGADVHLRQVCMPNLTPEELRGALRFEARKHLPLDRVDDPCLDFQVLQETTVANGNEGKEQAGLDVLLVAAPRSRRDHLLQILREAGIDPETIDTHPLPTVNTVLQAHPLENGTAIAVVDLGASASTLAVVDAEAGFYSRSLEYTGEKMTREIMDRLGFDRDAAETMKRDLYGAEAEQAGALLTDTVEELISRIGETIRYWSVNNRGRRVVRLYLTGGGALLGGLADWIRDGLDIDTALPDTLLGMEIKAKEEPDTRDRVLLAPALGLAQWWDFDAV